jgi:Starter unit:ACP transacylase in aflatoxin biosynthesis
MAPNIRILLFGDQSGDVIPALRPLLAAKDNPILVSFFEKAYLTLRNEVAQHPRTEHELPGFTSVENLLWRYSESGARSPEIESSLICIYQIASFLQSVYLLHP